MKKSKIVLFTLLLSIMGVVGSTNAASVNNSSRSADLMPSAASQLIQNSSLSETNIENSESGKCILWSPRIKSFKKGDQVKILLPHGKYTGKTLSVKVVSHGKEIATLTLEYGSDYGVLTFTVNANSGEIAQIIAAFGSMDFGAIGAGGVIDIGGMTGGCTGNTASKAPVAPVIGLSSSLSNRNDDNIGSSSSDSHSSSIKASSSSLSSKSSRISSSSDEEDGKAITRSFPRVNSGSSRSSWSSSSSYHGKGIIIDYGPGPVSIIIPSPLSSKSSSSSSLISASSTDKDTHRHPGWCPEKSGSRSKSSSSKLSLSSSSLVKSSSSSLTASSSSLKKLPASKSSSTSSSFGSSQSSKRSESKVKSSSIDKHSSMTRSSLKKSSKWTSSSSIRENGHHSRESIIIVVPVSEPGPVKENSVSINLNHSSSTIKIPAKIDHSSKKLPKISKKVKPAESKSHKNAKAKTEHAKAKAVKSAKTKTESAKAKSVKAAKAKTKAESRSTRKERVAGLAKNQAAKSAVRQASQPMVDQNGNLHLNPQQIRTLKHEMHFSNSKAAKAVKKMDKAAALHEASHESAKASNPSKQGLTLKHRNAAHPVSNVRRVTLPIQGILPATRMDPYTWVYSLVGLAIMIVSGRAFFSKKRK